MSETFKGIIQILNEAGALTIGLDGNNADVAMGGNGHDGDLILKDSSGKQILWLRAKNKDLLLGDQVPGEVTIRLDGGEGDIIIQRKFGGTYEEVLKFDASQAALYIGGKGNEGDVIVRDGEGRSVFHFDAASAALYLGASGNEGDIFVRNQAGDNTFQIDGNEGDISVWRKIDGIPREVLKFDASHAALYIGSKGNEGDIIVKDDQGRDVFHFDSRYAALYVGAAGNEGDIIVRDGAGNERIRLDGNTGDIRLQGADCAEEFNVTEVEEVDPGTVVVIDDECTLRPCKIPYDKKVAGVVSGCNGLNPGIILGKDLSQKNRLPVALNGRVFCKVDAQYAPIEVGDLLTTSPTPGHAMKAVNSENAFGAVIGKALQPFREGRGVLLILVALQ